MKIINNNTQLFTVFVALSITSKVVLGAYDDGINDDDVLPQMLSGMNPKCLVASQELANEHQDFSDALYDFLDAIQTSGNPQTGGFDVSFPLEARSTYQRSCSQIPGTRFTEVPEANFTCNTYGRNVETQITNYAYCLADTDDCNFLDGVEVAENLLSNVYGVQCATNADNVANTTELTQMSAFSPPNSISIGTDSPNAAPTTAPTATNPASTTTTTTAPTDPTPPIPMSIPSSDAPSATDAGSSTDVDELQKELEQEKTRREQAETELELLREQLSGKSDNNSTEAPSEVPAPSTPTASPSSSLRAPTQALTESSDGASFPMFNTALVGALMLIAALLI